jgi:hypothetical protein
MKNGRGRRKMNDIPEEDLPEWYAEFEEKAREKALARSKIDPSYSMETFEGFIDDEKKYFIITASSSQRGDEITALLKDFNKFDDAAALLAHITNMAYMVYQKRYQVSELATLIARAMKWMYLEGYEAKNPPSIFEEFIDDLGDERRE